VNLPRALRRAIPTLLILTLLLLVSAQTGLAADTSPARESFLRTQIANANAFITDPTIRSHKYSDMSASAFNFYRATAYVYYADLGSGVIAIPSAWKTQPNTKIWLSGDFHTQNIGFFDDDHGTVVFDLNDFDESYLGPFYWDLVRFSTSIYLMTTETGLNYSTSDKNDLVTYFLDKYQDTLQSFNGNNNETTTEMDVSYLQSGFVQDKLKDLRDHKTLSDLLNKWTVVASNQRHFNLTNSDLAAPTSTELTNIQNNWASYKQTLSSSFVNSKSSSYFNIKDVARRLNAGLGSQGVDQLYVLIEGDSSSLNDDQILQVKATTLPSLFQEGSTSQTQYNSWFTNHAQRAVTAQKAQGVRVDNHLGYMTFNNEAFKVARISPYKYGFDSSDFGSKSDVKDFVLYAAKALALAHARSDKDYNTTYINYNFEQAYADAIAALPQFKSTVQTLSSAYYQQVNADYTLFLDLLNTGQLS
jgi:uncharacterized protein (DUF2252 family)